MKKILITGSTGGIGKAFTTLLLDKNYELYLPVRNPQKAHDMFGDNPLIHIEQRTLHSYKDMYDYCMLRKEEGVVFDHAVLLIGDLIFDSEFPGSTIGEKEDASIKHHTETNVLTSQTVVKGLEDAYGETVKETILTGISSWAANFPKGHPYRKDEEGYVVTKDLLSRFLKGTREKGGFKKVVTEEPGLIRTPMTEKRFPHLLADPNVPKLEAQEYARHLVALLAL